MFKNDMIDVWGHMNAWLHWQVSLYDRYKQMVYRCERPKYKDYKNYGAKGIKNEFDSFRQYVQTVMKDPLFPQFIKDPDSYHIDKDIKYGHGASYSPSTISIVTVSANMREANLRNKVINNFGANNWTYHKVPKRVIVYFNSGVVKEFTSLKEAGKYFNKTPELIGMWVHGKSRLPSNVSKVVFGG